ncbi:MAG: helix-turn-helix domain-containing protein [Anaerolineae bacterium]
MRSHQTDATRKLPKQIKCPLCGAYVEDDLRTHILHGHGEEAFRRTVLAAKQQGMPDSEIGARFGISFGTLEQLITEAYGANVSVLRGPKPIKRWHPSDFREETTTV